MSPESKPQSLRNDEPDFSEPEPFARHRRDFESWASAPEHNCHLKRIEFGPQGGQYYHGYVEFAWRAWLEAATRQDGYRQTVEWLRDQLAQGTMISATDPAVPTLQIKGHPSGQWEIHGGLTLQLVPTS